jgi:hypothetical protein
MGTDLRGLAKVSVQRHASRNVPPHDHNVAKVTSFEVGPIGGFPETVAANRAKSKKELVNIEWHAKDGDLISQYKLHRHTFCCIPIASVPSLFRDQSVACWTLSQKFLFKGSNITEREKDFELKMTSQPDEGQGTSTFQ